MKNLMKMFHNVHYMNIFCLQAKVTIFLLMLSKIDYSLYELISNNENNELSRCRKTNFLNNIQDWITRTYIPIMNKR